MYKNPKLVFGVNGNWGNLELFHEEGNAIVHFPLNSALNKKLIETFGVEVGRAHLEGYRSEATVSKNQFNHSVFRGGTIAESMFRFSVNTSADQKEKFIAFVKEIYTFYNIPDASVEI